MNAINRPSYRDVRPVRDLVSDEQCYQAMQFLDESAHDFGVAKAQVEYLTYMIGVTEALGAQLSDERSVDKRKWDARTAQPYIDRVEALRQARMTFEELAAKREAAKLKVELARTIHADKRERGVQAPQQQRAYA